MVKTTVGKRLRRLANVKVIAAMMALALLAGAMTPFAGEASAAVLSRTSHQQHETRTCLTMLAGAGKLDTALNELVKAGTLTQAQAAAVKAKLAGEASPAAKRCAVEALLRETKVVEALQTLLGMNAQQIRAEHKSGKSLTEIAAARGVSRDKLVSTITGALSSGLDGLVANGMITTERKAEIMTELAPHIQTAVDAHKGVKPAKSGTPVAVASPVAASPVAS